jgi:hypothetical protein
MLAAIKATINTVFMVRLLLICIRPDLYSAANMDRYRSLPKWAIHSQVNERNTAALTGYSKLPRAASSRIHGLNRVFIEL